MFHALLGVLLTILIFPNPDILMLSMMVLASTIVDTDHIMLFKRALKSKRFGVESRSRFHEFYGLSIGLFVLYLLSFLTEISMPLMAAFVSHYTVDFLTRPTRPFYPFKKDVCDFKLYPRSLKGIAVFDTVLTGGLACLVLII